jgi:putative glycosyltransferase (TIGR04372 family)
MLSMKAMLNRRLKRIVIRICYFPIALLLYLVNVRVVPIICPDRIGHLCIEPDCFIKERLLGLQPAFKPLFLIPKKVVANKTMLGLWQRKIPILTSAVLCRLLAPLRTYSWAIYPVDKYAVAIDSTASGQEILGKWGARPPLLALDEGFKRRGFEILEKMGVPKDAWFVCVHSRDGHYSPADEHLHSYRNSSIGNYLPAMREIVERGGWCIRVGEPTPSALPETRGVIDYANSAYKSDWMDVFLGASCHFFLGNSSGLSLLSTVFGKQCALANIAPVSGALPLGWNDLGIPKLLRSRESHNLLSYRQILETPVANFRFTWQYEQAGIVVEENSPEDIRDLALEMLDRLSDAEPYEPEDEELQRRFLSLMRPGHYSYGAQSRIGRDFLRKHAALL